MYEIYEGFQTIYRLSKSVDILAEALKHIFKDFLGIIHSFYLEDNYQFEYFWSNITKLTIRASGFMASPLSQWQWSLLQQCWQPSMGSIGWTLSGWYSQIGTCISNRTHTVVSWRMHCKYFMCGGGGVQIYKLSHHQNGNNFNYIHNWIFHEI